MSRLSGPWLVLKNSSVSVKGIGLSLSLISWQMVNLLKQYRCGLFKYINNGGDMKTKSGSQKGKPDPERMAVLRSLPVEIKQTITGEEAEAFLHNEPLPDTLLAKIKEYIVDDDSGQE
jgi:hypothetical protein